MLSTQSIEDIVQNSIPNLEKITYTIPKSGIGVVLDHLGDRGSTSTGCVELESIWEYFQNSEDSFKLLNTERENAVHLVIDTKRQPSALLHYDNAAGMDLDTLRRIPEQVGNSLKKDKEDQKGKNATGALVWKNLGQKVAWVSRKEGHDTVIFVASRENWYDEQGPTCYIGKAAKNIPEPGTYVLISDLTPAAKELKLDKLRKYIGEEFREWIEDNGAKLFVTVDGTKRQVEPVRLYGGRKIIDETFCFSAEGKRYNAKIEIYLHPARKDRTISVRTKAKTAVPNLSSIPRFMDTVWSSENLSGLIRCEHLPETRSRSGLNMHSEIVDSCFKTMKEKYDQRLEDGVKQYNEQLHAQTSKGLCLKVQQAIQDALEEEIKQLAGGTYMAARNGEKADLEGEIEEPQKQPHKGGTYTGAHAGGTKRRLVNPTKRGQVEALEKLARVTISEKDLGPDERRRAVYTGDIKTIYLHKGHPEWLEEYTSKDPLRLLRHIADSVTYAIVANLHPSANAEAAMDDYIRFRKLVGRQLDK